MRLCSNSLAKFSAHSLRRIKREKGVRQIAGRKTFFVNFGREMILVKLLLPQVSNKKVGGTISCTQAK
jgi:hypothetical protein